MPDIINIANVLKNGKNEKKLKNKAIEKFLKLKVTNRIKKQANEKLLLKLHTA